MEYTQYIFRFIFRIRWWLLVLPLVVTLATIKITKHLDRTYDTSTTIYSGSASGYSIESSMIDNYNYGQRNATFDNISNIIISENTLKKVSIRLYAENMIHGDSYRDNNYIRSATYRELLRITPREVQKLIDKKDEEKTIVELLAYERPDPKNFVYGLFYWSHPHYSKQALLNNLKVNRIGDSDMIEIKYSSDDPGIAYNTLRILNDEFIAQYQELRYGETNKVIRFFEDELKKIAAQLKASEDSLTIYNTDKRIINYDEQTKEIAGLDNNFEVKYEDLLLEYTSAKAVIAQLEKRMDNHVKSLRNNTEFIRKLQNISDLTSKITNLEVSQGDSPSVNAIQSLNIYKKQLKDAESNFSLFSETYSSQKYTKEGISTDQVVIQWLDQLISMEKADAQLKVLDSRKNKLNQKYLFFSPIGSEIKRKERNINFTEQNYLAILNSLNAAKLSQKNIQMTSASLKVMNPPAFPIDPLPSKRKAIVMSSFFFTILFILGYFLLLELLDRTLRDKLRTERLTSGNVLGAFPGQGMLQFRKHSKICNLIATKFLSSSVLQYFSPGRRRIVNLLSTERGDGKTFIGTQLEEYWTSIGLKVQRITWHTDFDKDSRAFLFAKNITDIHTEADNADIIIVEYPPLKESSIPRELLNEGCINLLVTRANRAWKTTDQLLYTKLLKQTNDNFPVLFFLNKAQRDVVESFTGMLPPYSKYRKIINRISQFGLTAVE